MADLENEVMTMTYPMSKAMRMITINVRFVGVKVARIRLQIATLIFRFGGWVAGVNIEVETTPREG